MGAAQSNNVAQAVANVATYVDQSTTANSSQVNQTADNVNFQHCSVILSGNFNVTERATVSISNNQIVSAVQNANLQNNIQQQMLQEAASKVGFLGIGYASASNSASELTNVTNQVTNDMKAVATQYNSTSLSFTCDDSWIQANNLNIDLGSTSDFLSSQTLKQDQTAKIVNDVSQTVKQKATATVEGVSGILIAIILCIAVLIYSTGKAVSSPGAKTAITVGLSFLMSIVLAGMYLAKAPPLFAEPQECLLNSKIGKEANDDSECINTKPRTLAMAQPPLRYNYGILPGNASTTGGNLLQMSIGAVSNSMQGGIGQGSGDNGGYRIDVMQQFDTAILPNLVSLAKIAGVVPIPNPLMNPGAGPQQYLQIPVQYRQIKGDASDTESAKCTPMILEVVAGSPDLPTQCTGQTAPGTLSTTTIPKLGLANLNLQAWQDYVSGTGSYPLSLPGETVDMRKGFARFALISVAGGGAVDLHLYVHDFELIQFNDDNGNPVTAQAKDAASKGYRFVPDAPYTDLATGIQSGGGSITGPVGVWNTRAYKFQGFMQKFGIWAILGMFIFALVKMHQKPVSGVSK